MSSVRVQLKDILKINGLDKQLIEALALVNRLTLEKKPLAVVYNLTADLFMEQSLLLKDPEQSKKSISHGLIYYEKAAELAPNCVETAAAHGGALIALQLLGSAEVVLRRGIAIRDGDCDHPFVNHIGITPASGTKDQLIAEARLRMKKDLDYIKECHEGLLFNKVLMQLNNTGAQCSTILSAAKELADKQHGYARAKLLYPHVVLCLMRSGLLMSNQLTDQKRESILQSALKGVLDLVADFPNSLIISLYCAKLQISLGFFDAAEKEHRRALEIVNPDDPRDHEIPFGSTKGVNYMDRVLYTTLETIFGLIAPFHMFESTFRYLLKESKGSLLSVKVDNMLGFSQNEQGVIHEAVDYYKTNKSWVLWRCFWKDDSCKNFVASTPEELVLHVFRHTSLDDDGTILEKLLKHTLNDDMHCILDLAKDDEGHDVFCIKNLDVLFKAIFDVLTDSMMETTPRNPRFGAYVDRLPIPDSKDLEALMEKTRRIAAVLSGIKMETISPDSALDDFVDYLSALDLEKQDAKTFKVLEELWVKVLKSCVIDKQRALMALIATLKWGEIKEIIENQIAEAKTPDLDTSPENETLMQIPEMKGLEKSVAAAKPCHHAFMYGHRALQRRINALSTLADKNKMAQQEGPYDPYMEKTRHQEYVNKPTPPHLSHLVLCSACYFERANLRRFIQILHHFVKLHDSPGVKCQICAVRFVTVSALAYHMDYIHNVNLGNEQPSSK